MRLTSASRRTSSSHSSHLIALSTKIYPDTEQMAPKKPAATPQRRSTRQTTPSAKVMEDKVVKQAPAAKKAGPKQTTTTKKAPAKTSAPAKKASASTATKRGVSPAKKATSAKETASATTAAPPSRSTRSAAGKVVIDVPSDSSSDQDILGAAGDLIIVGPSIPRSPPKKLTREEKMAQVNALLNPPPPKPSSPQPATRGRGRPPGPSTKSTISRSAGYKPRPPSTFTPAVENPKPLSATAAKSKIHSLTQILSDHRPNGHILSDIRAAYFILKSAFHGGGLYTRAPKTAAKALLSAWESRAGLSGVAGIWKGGPGSWIATSTNPWWEGEFLKVFHEGAPECEVRTEMKGTEGVWEGLRAVRFGMGWVREEVGEEWEKVWLGAGEDLGECVRDRGKGLVVRKSIEGGGPVAKSSPAKSMKVRTQSPAKTTRPRTQSPAKTTRARTQSPAKKQAEKSPSKSGLGIVGGPFEHIEELQPTGQRRSTRISKSPSPGASKRSSSAAKRKKAVEEAFARTPAKSASPARKTSAASNKSPSPARKASNASNKSPPPTRKPSTSSAAGRTHHHPTADPASDSSSSSSSYTSPPSRRRSSSRHTSAISSPILSGPDRTEPALRTLATADEQRVEEGYDNRVVELPGKYVRARREVLGRWGVRDTYNPPGHRQGDEDEEEDDDDDGAGGAKRNPSTSSTKHPRIGVPSSTNPKTVNIPGHSERPNPFHDTLPGPETWHSRLPPFFPFGETPFMEQEMSRQINEDLANDHKTDDTTPPAAGGIIDTLKTGWKYLRGTPTPERQVKLPKSPWALPKVEERDVEWEWDELFRGLEAGKGKRKGSATAEERVSKRRRY